MKIYKHVGVYEGTVKIVNSGSRDIKYQVLDQLRTHEYPDLLIYPSKKFTYKVISWMWPGELQNNILKVRGVVDKHNLDIVTISFRRDRAKILAKVIHSFNVAGFVVEL